MRATLLGSFLGLLMAAALHAETIPAGYLEGDAAKRARLADLEGKPAPELDTRDWKNSKPLKLADLKGKIVVLDFWATWCGPCIKSIPKNNKIWSKYQKDGVVFIALTAPRGAEKTGQVIQEHKIEYPVATDTGKTNEAYHVNGFPDYFLIDRNGIVVGADVRNSKIEDALKALLQQQPASG